MLALLLDNTKKANSSLDVRAVVEMRAKEENDIPMRHTLCEGVVEVNSVDKVGRHNRHKQRVARHPGNPIEGDFPGLLFSRARCSLHDIHTLISTRIVIRRQLSFLRIAKIELMTSVAPSFPGIVDHTI